MKVKTAVTDARIKMDQQLYKPLYDSKYAFIWKKVQKLEPGKWLPVELKTPDEVQALSISAYTHRKLKMKVSRKGLTLYLSLRSNTRGRPRLKPFIKFKPPVRDIFAHYSDTLATGNPKIWDDVWEKVQKLKDGQWLPVELSSRADCQALKHAAYTQPKFFLNATVRGSIVYLRKASKEQIAIRKSAKIAQINLRKG